MEHYIKRVADAMLQDCLESSGVVVIQGPKWCGKTTTGAQAAQSAVYMDDPNGEALQLSSINPRKLLSGAVPRLIDEWQLAPQLWDAARFEVDHRTDSFGQFIFTGSAVPPITDKIHHTGTGRFCWLTMRPMSLWESGESSGGVSLSALFKGVLPDAEAKPLDLEKLSFLICRGGWPAALNMKPKAALNHANHYVDAVIHSDVSRVDGVKRDPGFVKKLLKSYARHQGGQATIPTIYADICSHEANSLSESSLAGYLQALKKIFVIEDMPAWNPNLRSKSAIRTSDTRYFVDPSIAVSAMGLGPDDLLNDLNTFGLWFETMAVRDLRVYAEAMGGNVYHFRDRNGLECDAVIHLRNGTYGLIEIKLGGDKLIQDGCKNLNILASKIDTERMPPPSFIMVLTGLGQYAYSREDGVFVVPISALKLQRLVVLQRVLILKRNIAAQIRCISELMN